MSELLIAMVLLFQTAGGRGGGGGGALPPSPAFREPTPFERFVAKLDLDDKKQLPDVEKIFTTASAESTAVGRELIQLRLRMVDDAAPVVGAYTAAATKMGGVEARTFQQVYALLTTNQQKKSADAYLLMAGLLDVALPRAPQGARGGGAASLTRMDFLISAFTLDGAQKKQVKSIMDADYKAAKPLREQWIASRTAIGLAIQSAKTPAELDQAVSAHAAQAAAMAAAEANALAKITAVLTAEQKAKTVAIQASVYVLRGAFAGKKWDTTPD